MSESIIPYLPDGWQAIITKFAEAFGYDPETVVAGMMAHEDIKKLPYDEQPKAVAVIVALYEIAGMVANDAT